MSNNERFNAMLNASSDPRRMYDTLLALAPMFRAMNERRRETTEQPATEEAAAV